jgi:exodeoxyribonuclease VII small subunit
MDFEKKLGRLEEIVQKMEKGELALDESLKLFEEGIKLSRDCHQRLNEAESKVKVLISVNDKGQTETKDFIVPEE